MRVEGSRAMERNDAGCESVLQVRMPDATLGGSRFCSPRSSNGRTAAFGAVNRGSNPCRGANL
jgi:hypothetical protein